MQDQVGECEVEGEATSKPICRENEEKSIEIALAPLDSTDIQLIRAWRNDYEIWRWCRQNDFISDYEQAEWFKRQAEDPKIKMYKIVLAGMNDEGQNKIVPIGVCGLTSIDLFNRNAEFSLYIAPAYQHRGFGETSLRILLTHGFDNLGLHIIWGEVLDGNPALEIFMKLGFRKEGHMKDFYFKDGKFVDAHIISMKGSEWKLSLN